MKPVAPPVRCQARRGVTLVIVLAFLVLLSTLIIAFFSSVQTEAVSSASYGSSVAAKQLVESALHVAMGQIGDATKSSKTSGSTADADRLAWASQPGMIRTWGTDGQGWKIFKLYTAKNMVVDYTGGVYKTADELATEVPNDWAAQPALYTDLNAPVLVADTTGLIDRNSVKYRAEFPILDPLSLGIKPPDPASGGLPPDRVEGFGLAPPPGYGGSTVADPTDPKKTRLQPKLDATTDPTAAPTANPAPMPVVWFYVLKDGTLTVPSGTDSGNKHIATWSGGQYAPSATNPIVGRIAFWGDDESCKLNLNTSSEPTPWDTPRAVSKADLAYGTYQPAQKEYQRFAGHPYMTALSPVFFPNQTVTAAQKQSIYGVIPRIVAGGSQSATVDVKSAGVITPDGERLFANVDEFLFQPTVTGTGARNDNIALDTGTDKLLDQLKRDRFFLTANSRAPEVSLFGGPRLSLWPESSNAGGRTAFDRLAAFCTTIGKPADKNLYYFQRTDSTSPTADYTGIQRNKDLYAYLQTLTSKKIPGFGGDFKTQWGNDRDQVLTEIFDYIRCVNLHDTQAGATQYTTNGQVAPISIQSNDTKGFGRFHTISQFGMHFICSQDGDSGLNSVDASQPKLGKDGGRAIEAALLFEPYSPSMGWYKLAENMFFDVTFTTPMTLDGQPLTMTSNGRALNNAVGNGWHCNGRERGGPGGLRGPVQGFGGANYAFVSSGTRPVVGKAGKTTMDFSGGTITVKVYSGGGIDSSKLIQTFTVSFPKGNFPIPSLVKTGTEAYRGGNSTADNFWWSFKRRFASAGSVPMAPGTDYYKPERRWVDEPEGKAGFKIGGLFRLEDVVRSVVPETGDIRLTAAKTAPGSEYVKVSQGYWEDTQQKFLHIFSEAVGTHTIYGNCNEATGASPAPGIPASDPKDQLHGSDQVQYHYSRLPEIRPGAGKLYNKYGDFDNGVAQATDGAYINKPDEGNTSTSNSPYYYFAWSFGEPTEVFFSPNRLVPSAGMLGSLPTGVKRNQPWQTLLFRPQAGHPGDPGYSDPATAKSPTNKAPDHLVMDLFWMPFAEPYAISEPFSTAGKINLNYEIAPFSYIRRATGLHGVLKSEEPLAIPNAASKIYKLWDHETNDNGFGVPKLGSACTDSQVKSDYDKAYNGQAPFDKMRVGIDAAETLSQFDDRFKAGEIFRTASQICEMHLVRKGEKLTDYTGPTPYWSKYLVTGDNSRERPYANIYSRLTTKSNVFTIHVRVQVLRKSPTGKADEWNEDRDRTVSEYRGSTIIERYIDAADPNLPDFASTANSAATLDTSYRFRMVSTKRFAP